MKKYAGTCFSAPPRWKCSGLGRICNYVKRQCCILQTHESTGKGLRCHPQEGLGVLQRDGSVFTCHSNMLDTIWHSEIGASAVILEAGFNLDCLLTKYQGVNWRNSSFANCNGGMNPMWEGRYDGISLNPLEQASNAGTLPVHVKHES